MLDNKNLPAYPQITYQDTDNVVGMFTQPGQTGISQRTLIAAMCLQGLLANSIYNNPNLKQKMITVPDAAACAVDYADALLTHLQNTEDAKDN